MRLQIDGCDRKQPRSAVSFCIWFFISALIGMATHVVWDSLTEAGSWAIAHLPFLHADLNTGYLVDRLLQHGSTLLGAIIIVLWYIGRFRSDELSIERLTVPKRWVVPRFGVVLSIVLVSAVFAVLAVKQTQDLEGSVGLEHALSLSFTSGIRIAVLATVIYSVIWHVVRQFQQLKSRRSTAQSETPASAAGMNRAGESC